MKLTSKSKQETGKAIQKHTSPAVKGQPRTQGAEVLAYLVKSNKKKNKLS